MRDGSVVPFNRALFLSANGLPETDDATGPELYPYFVNEAAYYEKDVALCLAGLERRRVRTLLIPPERGESRL